MDMEQMEDSLELEEEELQEGRPQGELLDVDSLLDRVLPSQINWRDMVRNHPMVSVLTVAVAGYVVGRTQGQNLLSLLSNAVSAAITRGLKDVLDGEFFDVD